MAIRSSYYIAIILLTAACSINVFADVKIKSKQSISGQSYENTTYIKDKRQRTETMNGMMVTLTQCDLRRSIQINPNTKTYMVNAFNTTVETVTKNAGTTVDKNGVVQSGGTVTTTVTTKDTGERKQMFGFIARHLIITMETTATADACNKTKTKMETDGWYIDFEPQFDCGNAVSYGGNNGGGRFGCQDKYVMKTNGTAKRGYPVYEKMTMFDESGKETMSYVNEVVELSKMPLDASLFDIPEGFREVSDASQMYAASSVSTSSGTSAGNSGMNARNSSAILLNNAPSVSSSSILSGASTIPVKTGDVGTKQDGVIRIGLASVKTGAVGDGIAAVDLAAAVQNSLIEYLKAPNIEVVTIDSKLAASIDAEAKERECDLVLFIIASHKKGGGGFGGMFGSALGAAIGRTGIGATGSTVGNIAGQIATQSIVTATSLSANIKAKDELTLDVKLNRTSGESALIRTIKVKAKGNGDDIIGSAVEQAAEAVVAAVRK